MRGLAPGTVIAGRYEIVEWIGEGAHAVTYRARDQRLGRTVALKILRPDLSADNELVQRFVREAQFAARVSHPNVVDVYDVGTDHDASYIVLRYIEGSDLKHRLQAEGRLPVDQAINLTIQVLRGLSAIHAAGIVHRDVKPQNILIGPDGDAQVTDFGVAYAALSDGLTTHGMTVGTASYMAPEQARGEPVTPRTDVYAVGVVLFEMLTGQLPFQGPNPVAVMLAHIEQPVPVPSQVAPDAGIPPRLDQIVVRALAKSPADRFPTAAAMADELAAVQWDRHTGSVSIADQPTIAVPVPPIARSRKGQSQSGQADARTRLGPVVPPSGSADAYGGRPAGPARPPASPTGPAAPAPRSSSTGSGKWLFGGALAVLLIAATIAGAFAFAGGLGGDDDGNGNGSSATATARTLMLVGRETATATTEATAPAATATVTVQPTATQTTEPTATRVPPTPTTVPPTATRVPPTATTVPTSTPTSVPPTSTPTPVPPTATPTEVPPTATLPLLPTSTPPEIVEDSPLIVPVATDAQVATNNGNAGNSSNGNGNNGNGNSAADASTENDGSALAGVSGETVTLDATQWAGAYANIQTGMYGRDAVALYGAGSGYSEATFTFWLDVVPAEPLVMVITGLDDEWAEPNSLQIVLNNLGGSQAFGPFANWDPGVPASGWTAVQVTIPPEYLVAGQNTLQIRNLTPGGRVGQPPYVLLGDVEISVGQPQGSSVVARTGTGTSNEETSGRIVPRSNSDNGNGNGNGNGNDDDDDD